MPTRAAASTIVVAGHVCLDVIPAMDSRAALEPGSLVEVGNASFAPGGAVANVGLALAKLGETPTLAGWTGGDPFGSILRERMEAVAAATGRTGLADGLGTFTGQATSYTVVISPPGQDRIFLHHPGCNDVFDPADLQPDRYPEASLLHFGYPPLMRRVYSDGGESLRRAFSRFRAARVGVSLDMAQPDPGSASGSVDWASFLARVLPEVDLFLPSWAEIRTMLPPSLRVAADPAPEAVGSVADWLLDHGPAVIALKLGDDGLYLQTASAERCASVGAGGLPPSWAGRELWSPNFEVEVRGTTGAGDATIAGLLAALRRGLDIEQALTMASATGAAAVEGLDAVGSVPDWSALAERIAAGWPRGTSPADGWRRANASGIRAGPRDPA